MNSISNRIGMEQSQNMGVTFLFGGENWVGQRDQLGRDIFQSLIKYIYWVGQRDQFRNL